MKTVLTIAGSDSSGGAGIQADLKTFEAFGLFGTSAITVLTAQNTQGVDAIQALPASFLKAQIESVLKDFDIAAIKIGMLYSKEIINAVKEVISTLDIPIVFDPVFISKAGSPLLQDESVEKMKELFKYAMVITPNRYEADQLFCYRNDDPDELRKMQDVKVPILVKNCLNKSPSGKVSIDILYDANEKHTFKSEYIDTNNLHGTGCSYSSAIAANLALGHPLKVSIDQAKKFIVEALRSAPKIGNGPGPINHKKGGENVS